MGKIGKFREWRTCNLRNLRFSWGIFLRSTNKGLYFSIQMWFQSCKDKEKEAKLERSGR